MLLALRRSGTPVLNIPALGDLLPDATAANISAPLQNLGPALQAGIANVVGTASAQLAANGLLPNLSSIAAMQPPPQPSPQGASSSSPVPGTTQGAPVPNSSTKSGANVGAIVAGEPAAATASAGLASVDYA